MDLSNKIFVFALILGAASQGHGPVFLLEPPSHLHFSNTTGSQVSCSAHGSPTPQVDWLLQDGQVVTAVPGLRQTLGNGTLYFPPFREEDYRKDVHSTIYRCRASNAAGTIISRDVSVEAVVNRYYEIQVYHTHVMSGNTAVFVCVIPDLVKKHVVVTSWSRDDSILLPGSNMGGRLIVTYGTGELHIRSARNEDSLSKYYCITLNSLTQERKRSAGATLTVTEPTRSMAPRLSPSVRTSATADIETDIHLMCSCQGNPPPTFSWYREINGHLQPVRPSPRLDPIQDILLIKMVKTEDSGRWTCKVSNNFGEQRLDIHLTVTAFLIVHVLPQIQVVNSGESATFNCTVSGSPLKEIQWMRNGKIISADETDKIKFLTPLVLHIESVTRHDRGMYQCVARNNRESAQGIAELRLGDIVPELQYTFTEQAIKPGSKVSLRCSATGSPPPQFRWFLNGEQLSDVDSGQRYAVSQFVDRLGDVISHLNVSDIKVEDGGLYSCRAINSLGAAEHSARLNVYGSPFIRSIGPVKAVAGADIILHCPYSGYPIESVKWERNGQEIVHDLRHRFDSGGSLTVSRLDPTTDSGSYSCYVTSREGETAKREIQLIVHSPPILEPFSFPASLQEGGRAQVTCYVTSGDMPIHFAWYKDGDSISATLQVEERAAEFYSMLIFKEVSSRHIGSYTCVASNSAARVNYTAHLMVKVPPHWIIEPQNVSTLSSNSLIVECSARGFPEPQITWFKEKGKASTEYQPMLSLDSRITLMANGSMWLKNVGPQDEGHYLCRATNGIGSGLGKVIYIGVNEPVRFELSVKNVSVNRGNPVTVICEVYGDSPIILRWAHNNKSLDTDKYRYPITNTMIDNGAKSLIVINKADKEDSGVYKCLAENAFGSSEHVINLAVQERPDPPSLLEVVEITSRSVGLIWRRPYDGNSPIVAYLVQYKIVNSKHQNKWDEVHALNLTVPPSDQTNLEDPLRESTVISGLLPATVYTIRMLSINSLDQSDFTEPIVVKTQEEAPSEAPKYMKVDAVGPGELFLSWSIPSRESWNGELLGYIVSWREVNNYSNSNKTVTVNGWATNKLQLTNLKKFTRYEITVRAFNSVAAGPQSASVMGTTKEGVPEASPSNISCSEISSQIMKISWDPPVQNQHGGVILGYKIFYRPVHTNLVDIPITGEVKRTSSSETYLHGLYKFTNYSIKVLAYTGAGDGVISDPLYCSTEEDLPESPMGIKAAALTDESILVSWLPPSKPNGRIILYTIYCREAGRVGKHTSFNLKTENKPPPDLTYQARNLKEHQLYEFWVSATTSIGEGEPTSLVAQATNSRAPSRIVSFSQTLHKSDKSEVLLPCTAVGNPTPWTKWIYRDRPITFSPFYEVTGDGHLKIHSIDSSLAGNYTCAAKNLFGEDEITYTIIVILPPSSPHLEIQFTTTTSVRLHWNHPEDGGATIQGYTLNVKHNTDDWKSIQLSAEQFVYTLENLYCGSPYHIYLLAYNRVGKGSPSVIQTVKTKGGLPLLPKEKDFITTNATTIQIDLYNWPDGGCPILHFTIQYKMIFADDWLLIGKKISKERIIIQNLLPGTWYRLKVIAENDAGITNGFFKFPTTTLTGEQIPMLTNLLENDNDTVSNEFYKDVYMLVILISAVAAVVIIVVGIIRIVIYKLKKNENYGSSVDEEVNEDHHRICEKTVEHDTGKNCQVNTASLRKSSIVKVADENMGTYEISPYATFNVPVPTNTRSVITSTLDYTMQFKTFGRVDEECRNVGAFPKNAKQLTWYKNRYNNEGSNAYNQRRVTTTRFSTRGDSDTDDTSGSACGDCSGGASYRVPIKLSKDVVRLDSSTDNDNEASPLTEKKLTPRRVGGRRLNHATSSNRYEIHTPLEDAPLDSGYSDNHEHNTTKCNRDSKFLKSPVEFTSIVARYKERKEQERKEFTIHV